MRIKQTPEKNKNRIAAMLLSFFFISTIVLVLQCAGEVKVDPLSLDPDELKEKAKDDQEPPKISISSPKHGEVLKHTFFTVRAEVTDDVYPHVVFLTLDDPNPESVYFTEEEFSQVLHGKPRYNLEAACKKVEEAGYNIPLVSPPQTTNWLNELLTKPEFYEIWREKHESIKLDPLAQHFYEITKNYHSTPFDQLEQMQKLNINTLNRFLLERTYPKLFPHEPRPNIVPRDPVSKEINKIKYKLANLMDGEHTITLTAIDAANNIASETIPFSIDANTEALSFMRVWVPYLYLYGVGGIFFIIGMIIITRSKSLNLERKYDRRWFKILVFGIFWYLLIHGSITLAAFLTPPPAVG